MEQSLHLLIVDRERREGLAIWRGARWLVPILRCRERARAAPLVVRWAAAHGVEGQVIGQWLGRMTPKADAIDWLVVVVANARAKEQQVAALDLRWTPLEVLKSAASLLDYQQWAVANATTGVLPSVPGPFGAATWIDEVQTWIGNIVGLSGAEPIVTHRTTPYEVVCSVSTRRGPVYFKGLSPGRAAEAAITSALSDVAPESFARTLALETRSDGSAWWLTGHCRGTALAADLTCERILRVAGACARIQGSLMDRVGAAVGSLIPKVELSSPAEWGSALLRAYGPPEEVDRCCAAIESACHAVTGDAVPRSWIALDLDSSNVLLADDTVRFIDLDHSYVGPAPLAFSTFLRRLRRSRAPRGAGDTSSDAACLAYETAWSPSLEVSGRWSQFEIVSTLLEDYLGWTRLVKKTERGEVYGVIEVANARVAQRLLRTVSGECWSTSAQWRR